MSNNQVKAWDEFQKLVSENIQNVQLHNVKKSLETIG